MTTLAFVLHAFSRTFADVLDFVLPVMYGLVFVLGVLTIAGRNPFERLTTTQIPVLRNPLAGSFVYGMAIAPLTLPCTGPIVLSAFTLGAVAGNSALIDQLAYFVAFSLGFGWPLVVLPLLGAPARKQILHLLTRHARPIRMASGVLLIGVAAIGAFTYL
jgi:cytochrome c-type biogenesis protein